MKRLENCIFLEKLIRMLSFQFHSIPHKSVFCEFLRKIFKIEMHITLRLGGVKKDEK